MPGGIDVREKHFELLIRAENPFLRHILYGLNRPYTLSAREFIEGHSGTVRGPVLADRAVLG